MTRRTHRTASPAQTEALGADLARELHPGSVVLVRGEVGAGKTTFVRGAARALGVSAPVTSPTFTIGNRFRTADGLAVSHLDLYRLADIGREDPELLEDYIDGAQIVFIEWPEHGARTLAHPDVLVTLHHRGEDLREVVIEPAPEGARR